MSPQLGQDGKNKNVSSSRKSDDSGDEDMVDGKGNVKRKSRNLSEKKRRDQFNVLINELCTMVCMGKRKLDKSNVLKTAISFIKNHNQMTVQTHTQGLQEDWKPSFLSNEEFTHLMLEALDGFIVVFSSDGQILYASENITSLLGHIPVDLMGTSIFDLFWEDERQQLTDLFKSLTNVDLGSPSTNQGQITFQCHLLRGNSQESTESDFEQVVFNGYYRQLNGHSDSMSACEEFPASSSGKEDSNQPILSEKDERCVFVASGRLQTPQLIVEMSVIDVSKSEFTSRHSLEWKFLFLDHRAPPIIGYLPFEVLGTSGYDYYHVDDLEQVSACHESLMQKGEGTSCCYRFLTKGQQWIWLQTQYYITYHQWNSKPEFIVCTHRAVPYSEVIGHGPRCVGSTLSPLLPSSKRTNSENVYHSQKVAISVSSPEKETLTKSHHFRTESKRSTVYTSQNTTSHKRASKGSDPKLSTSTHRSRSGQERLSTEDAKSTCSSESFKSTTSQQSRLSEQSLTSCQSRQSQVSLQSRQSAKSQQSVQSLASSLVGQRNVASTAQSHRLNEGRTLHHSPTYFVIASSNHSNVVTSSPSAAHLIPVPIIRSISPKNTRSPSESLNHTSLEIPFQQFAQPNSPRKCAPSSLSVPTSVVSYQPVLPIGIEVEPSPALTIPLLTVPGIVSQEIPPPMVLTAAQRHLYEQLKMKHSQLQRQILAQQEELKRVSEQLLIAQYGAWGPAMLKMTMPLQSELSESSGAATGLSSTAVTFTPATPILVQTSAPCIITQNSSSEPVCVADPSQVILRTTQQDLIQLSQQDVQMLLAQNVLQETPNMDCG